MTASTTGKRSTTLCRACGAPLGVPVLDLGPQPLIDDPVALEVASSIPQAPVRLVLCQSCGLAQLDQVTAPPAADPTVAAALVASRHGHGRRRAGASAAHLEATARWVLARTGLPAGSLVIDASSGDGAALEPYAAAGLAVLGHETHSELAAAANADGIRTVADALGSPASIAAGGGAGKARLVVVNHALAHMDDLVPMIGKIRDALAPDGLVAIETLDLGAVLRRGLFDVIGHAHRSYFSFASLAGLLSAHGLAIVDARRVPNHGGTLRVLARVAGMPAYSSVVERLTAQDAAVGVREPQAFAQLGERAAFAGERLHRHLMSARRDRTRVVGYGAPGRAVSILSLGRIDPDLLPFTVDRDVTKQGLALPGSGIPVREVGALDAARPSEVIVLAWTWAREIAAELARVGDWGGRLMTPLPRLRTLPLRAGDRR